MSIGEAMIIFWVGINVLMWPAVLYIRHSRQCEKCGLKIS